MKEQVRAAFRKVGARVPALLLPGAGVDYETFAVNACDQFSAEPRYWDEVERLVGDKPSAFRMILPEARLPQTRDKVEAIHETMSRYLKDGVLREMGEGLVFLRRETTGGIRKGLVIALDLEEYDYTPGSGSLIRATEKTVTERLPARIEIRRGAELELPHVMVLLDDRKDLLMTTLEKMTGRLTKLYDFPLMMGGGQLTGFHVTREEDLLTVAEILETLKKESDAGFLYAMGDGNHSVAAAKAFWEEQKTALTPEERENHPARFVLVELVNLYDEGLTFHPIHRLLMNVRKEETLRELQLDPAAPPPLQELQPKLDRFLAEHPEAELEYIHGAEECRTLGEREGSLAIVFEKFDRDTLFRDVKEHGVLCRKSFSMGEARDKRYYLEARRITPHY